MNAYTMGKLAFLAELGIKPAPLYGATYGSPEVQEGAMMYVPRDTFNIAYRGLQAGQTPEELINSVTSPLGTIYEAAIGGATGAVAGAGTGRLFGMSSTALPSLVGAGAGVATAIANNKFTEEMRKLEMREAINAVRARAQKTMDNPSLMRIRQNTANNNTEPQPLLLSRAEI